MHDRAELYLRCLICPCLLVAAACGGSDGTTEPPQLGPIRVAVVGGYAQTDTIGAMLAAPIKVQAVRVDPVTLAETPAANQLVNFVVVEEGCGRAFAGSAITDGNGNALDRWELGTQAGICHMEVRTVDQVTGQPVVYASASAIIKPGAIAYWSSYFRRVFLLSARVGSGSLIDWAMDRKANMLENPSMVIEPPPAWGATADSVFVPASETSEQRLVIKSGALSDTVRVTAVRDFRRHNWTTTPLTCVPAGRVSTGTDSVFVDSVVVPLITIDRVTYGAYYLPGKIDAGDAATYFEWSGVATYYLRDKTTKTRQVTAVQYFEQRDPLIILWGLGTAPPPFTLTSANPISYSGDREVWCNYAGWGEGTYPGGSRILTMTATP